MGGSALRWMTLSLAAVIGLIGCTSSRPSAPPVVPTEARSPRERPVVFAVTDDDAYLVVSVTSFTPTIPEIEVVDLQSGDVELVALPPGVFRVTFRQGHTADGRVPCMWSGGPRSPGGIGTLHLPTGTFHIVTEGPSLDANAMLSPSGKWMAFERNDSAASEAAHADIWHLAIVLASGGPVHQIVTGDLGSAGAMPWHHGLYSWDAEEDRLYFVDQPEDRAGPLELCTVEVGPDGPGSCVRRAIEGFPVATCVEVLPRPARGKAVLVTDPLAVDGSPHLRVWQVDLSDTPTAREAMQIPGREHFTESPPFWPLRFLRGEELVTMSVEGQLGRIDLTTRKRRDLSPQEELRGARKPYVSPSGQFLYWSDYGLGVVMRTPLERWDPEQLFAAYGNQ